jgi:hypothetical protein
MNHEIPPCIPQLWGTLILIPPEWGLGGENSIRAGGLLVISSRYTPCSLVCETDSHTLDYFLATISFVGGKLAC